MQLFSLLLSIEPNNYGDWTVGLNETQKGEDNHATRLGAKLTSDTPKELLLSEYTLSLGDLLQALWQWYWLVLVVTVVAVGSTLGYSFIQTPMYETSIIILVEQEQGSGAPGSLGSDVQGLQQLTRQVVEVVGSLPVTEGVVQKLNLQLSPDDLHSRLSIRQIPQTQFIEVAYKDPSPTQAEEVANAVGDVTGKEVSEMNLSDNHITATVWQRAKVPGKPVSPNFLFNISLALIVGITLGVVLMLLVKLLYSSRRL